MLLESIITKEVFSLQPNESWQHFIYFPYRLFRIWPFGQTLISGLQLIQTNTKFKYKRKELKRKLGVAWKGRGPGLHLLHIFKKYSFLHNLLGVDRTVRGTWSVQDPEMLKLGFSPGLCWYLLGMGSAWVMTLRGLNTRSGVLVILTRGKSHEGEE